MFPSQILGRSAWFLALREHSVYFSMRLALQTLRSILFLCVLLCLREIKIKATTSFGRSLMHSPKEKFVLLQKLRQLAKRFQKALPILIRSRNFDNLWRNGKTSGRPHFRIRKIKLILSFINTDILAMACLCHIEEIPKQCILGLSSSGLLSVEFPILQPQSRKQPPPPGFGRHEV